MIVHIYGLTDSRNGSIRYIGYTKKTVNERLEEHTKDKRKRPVRDWIHSLAKIGIKPSWVIIEESNGDECKQREVYWIAYYRSIGADLLNATDGGDGVVNPSAESRAKLSAYRKAHPNSPETAAKIGAANKKRVAEKRQSLGLPPKQTSLKIKGVDGRVGNTKSRGRKHTPEAKSKMSAAKRGKPNLKLRGRKLSPEQIEIIRQSRTGYKHTEESKNKMSVSRTGEKNHFFGKHHTPETKAKLSLARIGIAPPPKSDAGREAIAASKRGIPRSEKTKERIRKGRLKIDWSKKNSPCDVISPNGEIFRNIFNIADFARENGLGVSGFRSMCKGRRNSYKGWTLYKEDAQINRDNNSTLDLSRTEYDISEPGRVVFSQSP